MAVTQNIGCNTPASHLLQSCLVRSVCILHFVSMGSLQQSLNQTFKYSQHLSRAPSLFKLPMFLLNIIYIYILYTVHYSTVFKYHENIYNYYRSNLDLDDFMPSVSRAHAHGCCASHQSAPVKPVVFAGHLILSTEKRSFSGLVHFLVW